MIETGDTLGQTEAADAENRTRWLACIVHHNAWLACADQLIERGYMQAPIDGARNEVHE